MKLDEEARGVLIKTLKMRRRQIKLAQKECKAGWDPGEFPTNIAQCYSCRMMARRWGWEPKPLSWKKSDTLTNFIFDTCNNHHGKRSCVAKEYCQEYIDEVGEYYELGRYDEAITVIDQMLEKLNANK